MVHPAARARGETEKQRVDRNLEELLAELRVALPGVQVLFAFLLILPFSQRFEETTPFQEKVYFATLVLTAAATVLLIAPSVHHRIGFRRDVKERIVLFGQRSALIGFGALALAMTGAILLITDFLFDTAAATFATAGIGVLFAVLWWALPVRRLR